MNYEVELGSIMFEMDVLTEKAKLQGLRAPSMQLALEQSRHTVEDI